MLAINKTGTRVFYLVFAIIILYLFVVRLLLIFSYSLDLDGTEFIYVHFVQLLQQGIDLYRDPREAPFLAVLYFPGYPQLIYGLANWLKLDAVTDVHSILVLARSISLLMMLLNVFFVYQIFRHFKLPLFYVLLGITIYLLSITGHFYAMRPDCLKTTAFTVCFYLLLKYIQLPDFKYGLLFLICGITAVYIKQDAILSIYWLLLLLTGYYKSPKWWRLISAFTIALGIGLCLLPIFFRKYFYTNTVLFSLQLNTDIRNSFTFQIVIFSIVRNLPFLLAAVFTCRNIFLKPKKLEFFLPVLTLIFFITSHLSMLRAGSYLNYSYETILLLVLNGLLILKKFEPIVHRYFKILAGFLFSYLVFLFATNFLIHSYTFNPRQESNLKETYYSLLGERDLLKSIIQAEPVFFQNPKIAVYHSDLNLFYGYDVHFDRMVKSILGLSLKTHLLFFDSAVYDAYFYTGNVSYIVCEKKEIQKNAMVDFYPNYYPYKRTKHLLIYRYHKPS